MSSLFVKNGDVKKILFITNYIKGYPINIIFFGFIETH
jgi:hypothetical protein